MGSSHPNRPELNISAEIAQNLDAKSIGWSIPKLFPAQKNDQKFKNEYKQVLKIADDVAIRNRLNVAYSNFHTWEHLHQFQTGKEASEARRPLTFKWFQNCFYMAQECAEALRESLIDKGLPSWASQVKVATDSWSQRPTSARQYHCIVMVCCKDSCVIIDPVADYYAIEVPVNTVWKSKASTYSYFYFSMGSSRFLVQIHVAEPNNTLEHPKTRDKLTYNDPFREVRGGLKGGIENLVFPTDSYRGRVPSNRSILVDSVWNRKPSTDITYSALRDGSGKFIVETCRIGIDIKTRWIWITAIPQEWLTWSENTYYARRLKGRSYYGPCEHNPGIHVVWSLELTTLANIQSGFAKRTMASLEFMQELAEALGLKTGELMRVANVMLGYWQEEERRESRKDLKRKREGTVT